MIVILSTLNGESRLCSMLEEMLSVRLPAGTKFHVVDNGSEDGTLELLAAYAEKLPLVIYNQPVRGKNHCLNLVLASISDTLDPEEMVVLTDDDILPCPEWLEELEAAGKAHPDCDVLGGRILPHWPSRGAGQLGPLQRYFGVLFSITSTQEGPIRCDAAWGPNMAVRGRVFKAGYRFDPHFGPNGQMVYPMGSETELMERLDAAGYCAWFAERACVRHIIRAAQLDTINIIQRAFRHGYGVGRRRQRHRGFTRLASLQFNAMRALMLVHLRRLVSPPHQMLLDEYEEAWARGFADGAKSEYVAARQPAQGASAYSGLFEASHDPLNH
ncbi:MAG: glycosyltransferase [Hyphomonas sp.]|uniref:glycosyltransferase family 2 protein n=1 Tax=Hyphomonas sp. TaxID=87 RepID=UPI0034A089A1